MRFTEVLFRVNHHRHFQRMWKRQGKMEAQELKIPIELQEMGVPIKDAKEILLETKLFPPEVQVPFSIPKPPSVLNIAKSCFVMNNETKVSENENQTLSLTKTVRYEGLPEQVKSLIGVDSVPNQDELIQTGILQTQVWDGEQHKLPKLFDESRPAYNFKRIYGIQYSRRVAGLQEKLAFLCDMATGKYASCLLQNKILDAMSEIAINRNGDSVAFRMPCQIALTSNKPLKRFASESEVAKTQNEEVPSIFPIKSTLDLEKVQELPVLPTIPPFRNRYLHTLFLANKLEDEWLPKQNLSQALATCFSFCAKEAQMIYGTDVKELPEPIAVQCAYMDVKTFNFMVYQLNTLELGNNKGIKNQVWIDEEAPLYKEVKLPLYSDRVDFTTHVVDYNPEVFPKLLAFYINGLHPSTL